MHLYYIKVDSGKGGRQSNMVANPKFHVISQMAYTGADDNSCCLGDGIQPQTVEFQ